MTRRPLLRSALIAAFLSATAVPAFAESVPSPQAAPIPPVTTDATVQPATAPVVPMPNLSKPAANQTPVLKRGCNYSVSS